MTDHITAGQKEIADHSKSYVQVGIETKIPPAIIWSLILICALPYALALLGVDFSNHDKIMTGVSEVDTLFYRLSGAFTHALLEWSAFMAALFTVVLAFSHYSITRDITIPIIGVALFCAGCMDAFHTLAAARLIEAVADNNDLIPFTWAVCRIFNALIMIVGVGILLVRPQHSFNSDLKFIIAVSIFFAITGYVIIHICATSASLPQTQFPNAFITRPYDVIPLILFIFAGLVVYPLFCKKHPSLFANALLLSAIPEIVVEMHMAFGSTQLFDAHFNMAHFLKITAYIVPFIGLNLDYIRTYRREKQNNIKLQELTKNLTQQKVDLALANQKLKVSNSELEKFAYIASHDLQEPLRKVQAFGDRLKQTSADTLSDKGKDYLDRMQKASWRMSQLISDLLEFSRIQTHGKNMENVELGPLVSYCIEDLQIAIEESDAVIECAELPSVPGDKTQLEQLFRNLLSNAIKFREKNKKPIISIIYNGIKGGDHKSHCFEVHDNGIGISTEHKEKIFDVFQRLHGINEYQGSGIGLAICRRIVTRHGGEIHVEGSPGEGCIFSFTLQINN